MSKITKSRLTRGVVLHTDHLYGPVKDTADEMIASDLDEGNIKKYGSFRINWNIPYISARWFDCNNVATTEKGKPYRSVIFPFTLTPFQEHLNVNDDNGITGLPNINESRFILDQMSFGWDTRAEPRALRDGYNQMDWQGTAADDDIMYGGLAQRPEKASRQEFSVSLFEKENMTIAGTNAALAGVFKEDYALKKQVFEMRVPGATLGLTEQRHNPVTYENINAALSPFKTYALVIQCPFLDPRANYPDKTADDIDDAGTLGDYYLAMTNVVCSMRFKTDLKARLSNTGLEAEESPTIQNIPTISDGAQIAPAPSVGIPAVTENISAENTTSGVQTNLNEIDDILNNKLDSGYSRESDRGVKDAIETQGCYEVICVPMFGNKDAIRRTDILANTADNGRNVAANGYATNRTDPVYARPDDFEDAGLPYTIGAAGETKGTMDRRLIPIKYPMEIHHVVAHQNSFAPLVDSTLTGALKPRSGFQHCFITAVPAVGDNVTGFVPTDADLRTEIGVAIGNGIRGEGYTYQQIAYCIFNHSDGTDDSVPSKDEYVIDRIQHIDSFVQTRTYADWAAGNDLSFQHELISVPLVGDGAVTGKGWQADGNSAGKQQGPPIFVGQANSNTAGYEYDASSSAIGRSSIGSDTPWQDVTGVAQTGLAPGWTRGAEQFIEVRWKIWGDDDALVVAGARESGTGLPAWNKKQQEVLVGAGGHWVYIIGKKLLAGDMSAEGE